MQRNLFYDPWRGKQFRGSNTLILSESAYDWPIGGRWRTPASDHPRLSVSETIETLETSAYMAQMTRAICRRKAPTRRERSAAWNRYAYSIYVPGSVGRGAGRRPSCAQWEKAAAEFWMLVKSVAPKRIVVTGLDAWSRMPETQIYFGDRCQAYRVQGGKLVWCLAVPHPSNRREGFRWDEVGEAIAAFTGTRFPDAV